MIVSSQMMKYNKLISVGVDPGSRNGAIAIIDEQLNILYLAKAPFYLTESKSKKLKAKLNKETGKYETDYKKHAWTDFKSLREIYLPYVEGKYDILYTIEKVSVRSGEMEMSSFKFGDSLGIHRGQYSFLNPIFYAEPTPQVWKSEMGVTSDKNSSVELAEDLFKVNLKDYLSKGKKDDLAEALLLAFYGMKTYLIQIGEI